MAYSSYPSLQGVDVLLKTSKKKKKKNKNKNKNQNKNKNKNKKNCILSQLLELTFLNPTPPWSCFQTEANNRKQKQIERKTKAVESAPASTPVNSCC